MHLAKERQHMVLAQAEHLDVFHDHHLVICDRKQSLTEQSLGIFLVASREELIGLLDALRRASKSLAIWVLAEANKHLVREYRKGWELTGVGA